MDGDDVATAYYIHGPGIDQPLARVELNPDGSVKSIRFYLADALGSIIALADENGVVKTRYNYTPFGEPEIIGEASDNPFMFAGREYDAETGLLFERNRYYSPMLGRYISEDPIGFAGGDVNFYARVGNNPVNFTDPWGLEPGHPYDSQDEAAIAALKDAISKTIATGNEWGAWIIQLDNEHFTYTEANEGDSTSVIYPPRPDNVVACYHTHPDGSLTPSAKGKIPGSPEGDLSFKLGYIGAPDGRMSVYSRTDYGAKVQFIDPKYGRIESYTFVYRNKK